MVECVLNQEIAVIECRVYSGTEKGIVLHSALQTSFMSEVLLFSLKKKKRKRKKIMWNCGIPHSPLWWSEVKTEEKLTSDRLFTLIYKPVFSFSSPYLIFSNIMFQKWAKKYVYRRGNGKLKYLVMESSLFSNESAYIDTGLLSLLGESGDTALTCKFYRTNVCCHLWKCTLIAYVKYWVRRGLDYTFIQDSTF